MQDPAAREALLAEVKKYFDEVASLTKEHVTVSVLCCAVHMLPL